MVLWNWLIPNLFNLAEISYWQALGLALLLRCLFPGSSINMKGDKQ